MVKTQRRRFVQLVGGMLAAPILSHTHARAQGATGKPPLRFFATRENYGIPERNRERLWIDSTVGDYELTANSIGEILQPFRNHLDKLIVISDIDGESHNAVGGRRGHGGPHALTGSRATSLDAKGKMSHPSLDYAIGRYLNDEYGLASPRPFPSLFTSDSSTDKDTNPGSFDLDGNPIRGIIGYKNIFNALFGQGVPESGEENPFFALDQASRTMTLELVQERLRTLRPELQQSNASQVMDAYQTSVSEIGRELEARMSLGCSQPSELDSPWAGDTLDGRSIPLIFDAAYHAFACDLVGSFYHGYGGETRSFANYGHLYDADKHPNGLKGTLNRSAHGYSHRSDDVSLLAQQVARTYQMEETARLVDRMSETPDSDGSTLMDNTVMYIASGYSHTTHMLDGRGGIPLVILAGKNTNLRPGMHYNIAGSTINDVLTTLGQGTGVPLQSLGGYKSNQSRVDSINNGPIEKMLKGVLS